MPMLAADSTGPTAVSTGRRIAEQIRSAMLIATETAAEVGGLGVPLA